jgi:ParB-like chromosome segregation protein Spo0J
MKSKKIVTRKVSALKPHPAQLRCWQPHPEWRIKELAADMKKNGQDEAVEIDSEDQVISGMGRVSAAKLLGWKEVQCVIRTDLEVEGPGAVERRVIEANLYRRHGSKLDLIRAYSELKRLSKQRRSNYLSSLDKEDLRDVIGKQLGVSGRTLDRWLQLLQLPLPIQAAVDDGRLALTTAVKLVPLGEKSLPKFVEQMEAGTDPSDLAKELLGPGLGVKVKPRNGFARLLRSLKRADVEIGQQIENMSAKLFAYYLDDLTKGQQLLARISKRAKSKR